MAKKFKFGPLAKDNAKQIAERIIETLKGKVWVVATYHGCQNPDKLEVITNNILRTEWVDGAKDLVRFDEKGNVASVYFMGCGHTYTYSSFLNCAADRDNNVSGHSVTPEFTFESGEFHIKFLGWDGFHNLITFKVLHDMQYDISEYNHTELDAHIPKHLSALYESVSGTPTDITIPQDLRKLTKKATAQWIKWACDTLPLKELRKRQDLLDEQMTIAFPDPDNLPTGEMLAINERTCSNLRIHRNIIDAAVDKQQF